jgi:hypothetical protein
VAALVIGLPIWVSIALLLGESLAFAIEGWCVFMVIAVAVYGSVTIYAHRHG